MIKLLYIQMLIYAKTMLYAGKFPNQKFKESPYEAYTMKSLNSEFYIILRLQGLYLSET